MGKKNNKAKTFELQMMDTGLFPNIIAATVVATYMFYFAGMPYSELGTWNIVKMILMMVAVTMALQFLVAPHTNRFLTQDLSKTLENIENLNEAERTDTAKKLMGLPLYICIQVLLVFYIGALTVILGFFIFFGIKLNIVLFCSLTSFYGAVDAGVLAYCYAEKLCTKYNYILIKKGIDKEVAHKDKVFGMKMYARVIYHIVLPFLFANLIEAVYVIKQNLFPADKNVFLMNTAILIVFNLIICVIMSYVFFDHILGMVKQINEILKKTTEGNIIGEESTDNFYLPTDLGTELSYTNYIINDLTKHLYSIAQDADKTGKDIFTTTQDLSVSAKETADTSLLQLQSVNNCVSTMNDVKELLLEVSKNITDVSQDASMTLESVNDISVILTQNMLKVSEITQANIDTITGIKNLSEQIDKVWGIIATIDTIAGKTRTIAFNAEIEASSVGEQGENFHTVANEIRRLAATITDSTKEIRSRITAIQHASDNLIIASEGGTEKIREGSILFSKLEEKFNELKTSSEITAESASDIQVINSEQDSSFVQISQTLEQLSIGFETFTQSAQIISTSAEQLKEIALSLNSIQKEP